MKEDQHMLRLYRTSLGVIPPSPPYLSRKSLQLLWSSGSWIKLRQCLVSIAETEIGLVLELTDHDGLGNCPAWRVSASAPQLEKYEPETMMRGL